MKKAAKKRVKRGDAAASRIPDAYEIKQTRAECKKRGLQSKEAMAYMSDGRVAFTFSEDGSARALDVESLYQQWVRESEFGDFLLQHRGCSEPPKLPPRFVRCVVCSQGDSWEVWEETEVCRLLINPGEQSGEGWAFIPIEKTILDPDRKDSVWHVEHNTPVADRSLHFSAGVLHEAARLYLQACQLVPGFLAAYEALDLSGTVSNASAVARLIRDCKKAALRHIEACVFLASAGMRQQDEAIAARQGFLMGGWLAQAEAILTNARTSALAAALGAGKPQSKFWFWLNADPQFAGKSAKEVWSMLDGQTDPDHPKKKLKLTRDRLQRGDGSWLKATSFTASFKKRRGSIFQR